MPTFRRLCTIEAHMSSMASALESRVARSGKFWLLDFKVEVTFKGTTLRGKLVWEDEVRRTQLDHSLEL
jgi:hypothetical protein